MEMGKVVFKEVFSFVWVIVESFCILFWVVILYLMIIIGVCFFFLVLVVCMCVGVKFWWFVEMFCDFCEVLKLVDGVCF